MKAGLVILETKTSTTGRDGFVTCGKPTRALPITHPRIIHQVLWLSGLQCASNMPCPVTHLHAGSAVLGILVEETLKRHYFYFYFIKNNFNFKMWLCDISWPVAISTLPSQCSFAFSASSAFSLRNYRSLQQVYKSACFWAWFCMI